MLPELLFYLRYEVKTLGGPIGTLQSYRSGAYCRRSPPTATPDGKAVWPSPDWDDWCGEHVLNGEFNESLPKPKAPRQIGFRSPEGVAHEA